MAIYSGFATRKLEDKYNQLIMDTINLMSQIIITYVERTKLTPFETQFNKLFTHIEKLDNLKHSEPKYSFNLKPLNFHINLVEETSELSEEEKKIAKRRPMTSNTLPHRRQSAEYERKTINTMPNKPNKTQPQKQAVRKIKNNFSLDKGNKAFELTEEPYQTMEELMSKNQLVERKMSAFRKKKYLQHSKIPRIQELQEENQMSFF